MADYESRIGISIDADGALAAIKTLQSQISAFHQSIRNSGNAVNQAVSDNLTKNLLNSINATKIGSGNVDNTELGYLNGVTSNIQTQLDAKASLGDAISFAVALGS